MTPLLPSGLWSVEPGPVISVEHLGEEIRQQGDRHEEGERERKEEGDVLDNDGFNAASHRRALIRAGGWSTRGGLQILRGRRGLGV